jgi:hypothetical protein
MIIILPILVAVVFRTLQLMNCSIEHLNYDLAKIKKNKYGGTMKKFCNTKYNFAT